MDSDRALSDLLMRWEEHQQQGQSIAVEELCRDCPELLPQLRQAIEALACAPTVVAATSLSQPGTSSSDLPTAEVLACPAVAGYEIMGALGRGGMGVVYRARDLRLDRIVALKMLRAPEGDDSQRLSRFHTEARVMARLDHPHIVPIYEQGECQGQPYFTMKLLSRGSLAQQLRRLGADLPRAVALMEKVARGVHYLHTRKILHRDLKPHNILLDEHDEPFVTDFGLVKLQEANLESTLPGMVMGTLPYMAPEQATGQAHRYGPATDVWALGVILFELLTGKRPFAGEDRIELTSQILSQEPRPPRSLQPTLDSRLEAVILKCLRKEPAERYPSAEALADDLARIKAGAPVPGGRQRWRLSLPRPHANRRRRLILWALVVLLSAGLGYSAWRMTSLPSETPAQQAPPVSTVLVGPTGPPLQMHWIAGEKTAILGEAADGTFSLRTSNLALLELQVAPPLPYRLEAEVRHEASAGGGVGLFLGYHPSRIDGQPHHSFLALSFTDKGQRKAPLGLTLSRSPASMPWVISGTTVVRAEPVGPRAAGSDWRKLVLTVTHDEVCGSLDEEYSLQVPRTRFTELEQTMERSIPGGWSFTPEGGLGLYLSNGSASFRHVVLTTPP